MSAFNLVRAVTRTTLTIASALFLAALAATIGATAECGAFIPADEAIPAPCGDEDDL